MKMKMKLILAMLTMSALLGSCRWYPVPEPAPKLGVGDSIPEFTVTTIDGKKVSTSDLMGKASVIVLFTTTCSDCAAQLPEVQKLCNTWTSMINVICVARDDNEVKVKNYWDTNKYTMPVAAPGDRSIYNLFDNGSQTGVPQVYIGDEKGEIIFTSDDSKLATYDEMHDVIDKLNTITVVVAD